jgi:hypothetical protein
MCCPLIGALCVGVVHMMKAGSGLCGTVRHLTVHEQQDGEYGGSFAADDCQSAEHNAHRFDRWIFHLLCRDGR